MLTRVLEVRKAPGSLKHCCLIQIAAAESETAFIFILFAAVTAEVAAEPSVPATSSWR